MASVGVDFHVFDGIFQGSRSHIVGIFSEAVSLAEDIDFIFFLHDVEQLKRDYPTFVRPNVRLVEMRGGGLSRLVFRLALLQRRYSLDLLHTQYRVPLIPMGPCACTIHDVLFESHPQYFSRSFSIQSRLTFRLAAKVSKLLFTVSEFSKREICSRYGVDASAVHVIHNGVDRQKFFPGSQGEHVLEEFGLCAGGYLLTVGRLEPRKNHVRLIEAYSLLGSSAPPLVVVGQRDFSFAKVFQAVSHFGVADRVIFLEDVDDKTLPVLMRNSRLFVFPSIAEGFGMPVLEALASGVPVVTSNSTSLVEISGDAALLVDPMSSESIAAGMRRVLGDDALAGELRSKGVAQARNFEWRDSARTLVEAYRGYFANVG